MKTILAATDFSPASHNACLYAQELSRAFGARLILFNAYQAVPVPVSEVPVMITPEDMRKIAQQQLEDEVRTIDPAETVSIRTVCREGFATGSILQAAKENKADLIVTGMKAGSKGFRKVLGSTVTALAQKTTIPLIVVPEEARFKRIDTIALANDSDLAPDADPHILDAFREIAERFQPKLYLVRITKNKFSEAYEVLNRPFKLNRMLRTLDPVYECIEGKDVTEALDAFINGYGVNMLAIMPHKHSLFEKWFVKSTTRSVIFETHIPLLILPDLHVKHSDQTQSEKESSL